MLEAKCPAAEMQNPVLADRPAVECRITGKLKPARKSPNPMQVKGTKQVCCADYASCPVWQAHKRAMAMDKTVAIQETQRNQRAHHVMTGPGHERESVTIGHG